MFYIYLYIFIFFRLPVAMKKKEIYKINMEYGWAGDKRWLEYTFQGCNCLLRDLA